MTRLNLNYTPPALFNQEPNITAASSEEPSLDFSSDTSNGVARVKNLYEDVLDRFTLNIGENTVIRPIIERDGLKLNYDGIEIQYTIGI